MFVFPPLSIILIFNNSNKKGVDDTISDDKEAFNASVLFPYQHLHLEMRLPNLLFHYFLYRSPSLVKELQQLYTA